MGLLMVAIETERELGWVSIKLTNSRRGRHLYMFSLLFQFRRISWSMISCTIDPALWFKRHQTSSVSSGSELEASANEILRIDSETKSVPLA